MILPQKVLYVIYGIGNMQLPSYAFFRMENEFAPQEMTMETIHLSLVVSKRVTSLNLPSILFFYLNILYI
jgi:hypothetical protein